MTRRLLIRKLAHLFEVAKNQSWYHGLLKLPYYMRIIIGTVLVIYGVIAILSPLPLGLVCTIVGASLILGLRQAKYYLFRIIYSLRIHILFSKVYLWWKKVMHSK